MLKHAFLLVALPCVAAILPAADELVPRRTAGSLSAPLLAAAPAIDGKLDDAVWRQAQPLRDFAYTKSGVRFQTEGWIGRDAGNFYVAVRCFEDDLNGLVTQHEGKALWKNDVVELYVVPEQDPLFYSHLILCCDGRVGTVSWTKDAWGEPTEGPPPAIRCVAGREKDAWTLEVVIPLSSFPMQLDPAKPWALGLNREKHSKPAENSSFQGGFAKPGQYPELTFAPRSVVADGVGLRNLGAAAQTVQVLVQAEGEGAQPGKAVSLAIPAGQRVAIPWREQLAKASEGLAFSITTTADGSAPLREAYVLVPPARGEAMPDTSAIPPAQFAPSVFDDPAFFPISVWLQPAGEAKDYAEMGVNIFIGGSDAYPSPKGAAFLDALQPHGLKAMVPFSSAQVEAGMHKHPAFLAWYFGDEPDNADPATGQVKHPPEELLGLFAAARTADPTHRVFLNLGQGVGEERFMGRGASISQYQEYPKACDIICFDVYPCNSVHPNGPDRLHLVAKGIDRLRQWSGPDKPAWAWIEVNKFGKSGKGDEDSRAPTPAEVKTQIWMALVHGAKGYGFFCHSWNKEWIQAELGSSKASSVTAIAPAMRAALKAINAEVKALATVLNSPDAVPGATAAPSKGSRIDTLTKSVGGQVHVFAVNMFRKEDAVTITVPGVADGEAEVLSENRTVAVRGGIIRDAFAPYAVHLYRMKAK